MLVSSFSILCALEFVGFLSFGKGAFLKSYLIFSYLLVMLSGSWFGYAFCCYFNEGSDEVFIFVIRSMCFRHLLKCIEFVSYSYCIFIANISIGK